MKLYHADFTVLVTVTFEDNGEDNLTDQAHDAVMSELSFGDAQHMGTDIVGKVRPHDPQ